jgi:hypothetical protein
MEELFLIYINPLNRDWKGDYIYEFIYSDSIDNVDGEDWDLVPASGQPQPPRRDLIKKVGRLESKLELEVVQNSDTFSMWDAVDGIVALAFENIMGYEEYPEKRIGFKFGTPIKEVDTILYERDFVLDYNIKGNEKFKEQNS